MSKTLTLKLNRTAKTALAEQIHLGIMTAIDSGVLAPGARLPSWLDLAAQLGVARGTVKAAYERLADAQLVVASRPGGTRVAGRPIRTATPAHDAEMDPLPDLYRDFYPPGPAIFQNGVPAPDCFPVTLFSRLRSQAARKEVAGSPTYPDPRGAPELRREIAATLALSRGMDVRPSQIFITVGFSGALGIVLRGLRTEGRKAWIENPCFPPSRRALELSQLQPVPVPIDENGIDVSYGLKHAPDAALALVTPGQQAPLGSTLSRVRRLQLIDWARDTGAWIIEDDYLGELQLKRRAAPALASLDKTGRVIHIGSFSKTISPTLRLGFLVAPRPLVSRFAEVVACLAPAPDSAVQLAIAEFIREGHYLRHLRRMKRIYASRSNALRVLLESKGYAALPAGLAILLKLPDGAHDKVIAREARAYGLAPAPLSSWFASSTAKDVPQAGLLLGVAPSQEEQLPAACKCLDRLIRKFS